MLQGAHDPLMLALDRYTDAARTFNTILAYINRVKQYHQRSVQYDQILKKNEQVRGWMGVSWMVGGDEC